MTIAVNPTATRTVITPEDKDLKPEEQSKWTISNLTTAERAFLNNLTGVGDSIVYAMHLGLASVEDFYDGDGNAIKLERDATARPIIGKKKPWKPECLDRIPPKVQDFIYGEVMKGAEIPEAAAKNL